MCSLGVADEVSVKKLFEKYLCKSLRLIKKFRIRITVWIFKD